MGFEDPARRRATSHWGFGSDVRYTVRHKFFNNQAEDDLMVLFVRDLVRHRLDRRLRDEIGGAVYGLEVSTAQRGPVGFLEIEISVADIEDDFVRGILRQEIVALV